MGSLESDTTEWLPFHFSLSCIGEGNGNPLQCSCLENPKDGGAWWAAVHGVARVGHDWMTSLSLFTLMHWRRKWQPTPVFLPGESQGQEAWWAAVYGSHRVGHDWSDLAAAAAAGVLHWIIFWLLATGEKGSLGMGLFVPQLILEGMS